MTLTDIEELSGCLREEFHFLRDLADILDDLIAVAKAAKAAVGGWDFDHSGVAINDIRDELNVLQDKLAALEAE